MCVIIYMYCVYVCECSYLCMYVCVFLYMYVCLSDFEYLYVCLQRKLIIAGKYDDSISNMMITMVKMKITVIISMVMINRYVIKTIF